MTQRLGRQRSACWYRIDTQKHSSYANRLLITANQSFATLYVGLSANKKAGETKLL